MDVIRKFEPLFGDWYVESFIGAGSFGRVYKIYREELGRRFYSALKYISIPAEEGEIRQLRMEGMDNNSISGYYDDLAQNVYTEISMMDNLKGHTNIVSFADSRILPKPTGIGYDIFIRMELLESLSGRMIDDPLTTEEIAELGKDVCSALILCKRKGIIHRDIKPDNIFISSNGDYKLGDFGVARQLEKTATFMSKKGTPNYMAPEVYKGEEYGATCDVYSLGLVIYRLLNENRLPFLPPIPQPITPEIREQAIIRRMRGEPLPAPKHGSEALKRIVLKACAYDPKDRYASAAEMKQALERITDFADETTESPAIPAPAERPQRMVPVQSSNERTISLFNHTPEVREQKNEDATVALFQRAQTQKAPERKPEPEAAPEKTEEKRNPAPKPEKPADRKTTDKGPKKKLLIIGAAAALAVIAAVVLIVVLVGKGKSSQQAEAQPTAISSSQPVLTEIPTKVPTKEPTEKPTPTPTKKPTPTPTRIPLPTPTPWVEGDWDWLLDNGILMIFGEGNTKAFDRDDSPWYENRESIKQVVIEDGITGIGSCAFLGCSNLTGVTIPDSVTSIGEGAFLGCSSLKDIYFGGSEAQWKAISIDDFNGYLQNATIHYNSH